MVTNKHSKNYEKVKKYYDRDQWSLRMVWKAVNKWITVDEYKEITGYDYDAENAPSEL